MLWVLKQTHEPWSSWGTVSEVRMAHNLMRLIIRFKFKKDVAYPLLCNQSGPSIKTRLLFRYVLGKVALSNPFLGIWRFFKNLYTSWYEFSFAPFKAPLCHFMGCSWKFPRTDRSFIFFHFWTRIFTNWVKGLRRRTTLAIWQIVFAFSRLNHLYKKLKTVPGDPVWFVIFIQSLPWLFVVGLG